MSETTQNQLSKLISYLADVDNDLSILSKSKNDSNEVLAFETTQLYLNNCLIKLKELEGIKSLQNESIEYNALLDDIQKLNDSIKDDLQDRFLLFQSDTQLRNQINMSLESYELKAKAELESWFRKLFNHYNSIVNRIDLDIQQQGSLSFRFNHLIRSLFHKSVQDSVIVESIKQCIDLLKSFSNNELYITGIASLADNLELMLKVPNKKLTSFEIINVNKELEKSSFYRTRQTIFNKLNKLCGNSLDNYIDDNLSIPYSITELETTIKKTDLSIHNYLQNYIYYTLRIITATLITDLSSYLITSKISYTKTLNFYREETIRARKELKRTLSSNLSAYIQLIKTRINANFNTFDAMLLTEQKEIELLYSTCNKIDQTLINIKPLITI